MKRPFRGSSGSQSMLLAFLLFILVSAIGAGVFVFLKKYDACSMFEGSFWVWPQMRCYTSPR